MTNISNEFVMKSTLLAKKTLVVRNPLDMIESLVLVNENSLWVLKMLK